jgi:hypothetical protein
MKVIFSQRVTYLAGVKEVWWGKEVFGKEVTDKFFKLKAS